jgi:hypothetical protein
VRGGGGNRGRAHRRTAWWLPTEEAHRKGSRGKSAGFRTIVAYRQHDRLVFIYMSAKNERDNITEREQAALSELGDQYMHLSAAKLHEMVTNDTLAEVICHGDH